MAALRCFKNMVLIQGVRVHVFCEDVSVFFFFFKVCSVLLAAICFLTAFQNITFTSRISDKYSDLSKHPALFTVAVIHYSHECSAVLLAAFP